MTQVSSCAEFQIRVGARSVWEVRRTLVYTCDSAYSSQAATVCRGCTSRLGSHLIYCSRGSITALMGKYSRYKCDVVYYLVLTRLGFPSN